LHDRDTALHLGFVVSLLLKMNFYLSGLDDLLRHPDDQPSLGLILCKTQNRLIAEYALRGSHKPLGAATYRLAHTLPANLRGSMRPSKIWKRG
jgi:hypothetical protein